MKIANGMIVGPDMSKFTWTRQMILVPYWSSPKPINLFFWTRKSEPTQTIRNNKRPLLYGVKITLT